MESASASDLAAALERVKRDLADRDRRILHLKTLYDASRELSVLSEPQRILDTFLLMCMGPLGASKGFALSMGTDGSLPRLAARGLGADETGPLREGVGDLSGMLFGEGCSLVEGRVEIMDAVPSPPSCLPGSLGVLVRWCGPDGRAGLLGLGGCADGCVDGAAEREFLARLAGVLVSALRRALTEQAVRELGLSLGRKNTQYEQAADAAERAKDELARRVFHLNTLYEANSELSGMVETRRILETFLLTVMGALSARRGGVYLHGERPCLVLRGGRTDEPGGAQRDLARFFESAGGRDPIPMSVRLLRGDKVLAGTGFPFTPQLVVAFAVDGETQGLLAVGEALDGREYGSEECDLLRALAGNVLVYLKNARYFEEITSLNRDLTSRNEELNRLLEEVSQCRLELSDVERARQKILEIVRRETSRSGRVRRADFVFLLLVPLCIGLLFNFSNPAGVRLVPETWTAQPVERIDVRSARHLALSGALVVDARPADVHRAAHIRGALNVPRSLFDFVYSMRLASLDPTRPVIVYGRTVSRHYDEEVALLLRRREFGNVRVLSGGLGAWERNGYPVERQ